MKKNVYLVLLCWFIIGCSQTSDKKDYSDDYFLTTFESTKNSREYFVKPMSFVCDYPFDEVSKFALTCRIWGLLKYYHPNVTAGKLDWDEVLLDATNNINNSDNADAVNREIMKMIQTAGEYKKPKKDNFNDSLKMNVNLCWIDNSFLNDEIKQKLREISSLTVGYPSYYAPVQDSTNFIRFKNEKNNQYSHENYKHRLLTLFRCWNAVYYFFPYKYLMDKSWDVSLSEFIPKFISASDETSFHKVIIELAVSVNDGHAYPSVETGSFWFWGRDPLPLVEDNLVIRIPPEKSLLKAGDIVLKLGNKDVMAIKDSVAALVTSSNTHATNYRSNLYLYQKIIDGTELTISRNGQKIPISVEKIYTDWDLKDKTSYKKISDSIGYVNLDELRTIEVSDVFNNLKNTKGIILDLRNYPLKSSYYDVIKHLSEKQVHKYLQFTYPDISHPGAFYWKQTVMPYTEEEIMNSLKYTGKIVVLISEITMSNAETTAVMYRTAANAVLIGRPTAGANGNIAYMFLPTGVQSSFSGLGAYYPDRSEIQRIGVIPDIEVYPTMESIKAGKDEILETAIEYLTKTGS